MSLQQLAAQRMASQGRGPDTQLVHMSPREVAGLQALAMAQGGSLTINPETGLPEAGFLDQMLPMILGIGAMALTGGAAGAAMPGLFGMGMPATIGLGVGALQTARTGSLEKGLMAGLGAYGGAGLAGGLMAAGAGTGASVAGSVGPQTAAIDALGAPMTQAATSVTPTIGAGTLGTGAFDTVGNVLDARLQKSVVGGAAPVASPLTALPPAAPTIPPAAAAQPSIGGGFQQMGRGISALTEPGGRQAFMGQAASKGVEATGVGGGMGLLKYGAAAAAPMLMGETKTKMPEEDNERFNYAFDAGRTEEGYVDPVTGQRQYFKPTYTRYAAAGGPVEDMSAANVYDMQNARGGVSDMGIDNSTGMQRMAGGGISALKALSGYGDDEARDNYTYDPTTKKYAKIAPVVSPIAVAAALNAMDYGGGYGGNEMGSGPGLAGLSAAAQGEAYGDAAIGAFDAASADAAAGAAGAAAGESAGAGLGYGAGGYDGGGDGSGGFYAKGGNISHLGDYSDGGRLLKGPGDGVSDSIPAMIGNRQPARLADGEFVVPARIVSELGNGSTEAGARKLYAMMDRIQKARGKTVGKGKVAKNSRAEKYLPA